MTVDNRIVYGRPAVFDNTDIGAGTADLKVDPVGGSQVHQSADDASRRTGQHGKHRAFFHLGDIHNSAIAAHDHQWRFDAHLANAAFSAGGRFETSGAICWR